ncbi:MAG: methylthioribulose 1-phosphate dehydratase [Myxococcales bacterium]|nr:methylthioribulose 1-phosphate dehydratase [Myxococcales bacterium]MCB9736351.1 methylthioribulose 1-phosphate dehydratase [Deltaproteobacteria bacterium]
MSAGGGVPGLDAATRELRRGLMRLGQRYDARGWLFGTCGNLSGRDGDRITITASGRHKGELGEDDFVTVDLGGALVAGPPGGRPSAETSIHLALYEAVATARVIVHVHTVASSLVRGEAPVDAALQHAAGVVGELRFEGLEMVKGWDLWSPEARPVMPVFENHADVPAIARDVGRYYAAAPREVPALLIAGHGLTAWGASLFEANRHLEVAEFLCQVALANARR